MSRFSIWLEGEFDSEHELLGIAMQEAQLAANERGCVAIVCDERYQQDTEVSPRRRDTTEEDQA